MTQITTHVLDAVLGKPAAGIKVRLERRDGPAWSAAGAGATDADGRCRNLAPNVEAGTYRLTFETAAYFAQMNRPSIYPEVTVTVHADADQHYHLPLLLSDNSYTTYRGS